jgi:hypothetical protein
MKAMKVLTQVSYFEIVPRLARRGGSIKLRSGRWRREDLQVLRWYRETTSMAVPAQPPTTSSWLPAKSWQHFMAGGYVFTLKQKSLFR